MGRTHSNAFLQAPRYFDLPFEPVLKAVAARNKDRVEAFAANWGYESAETDWRTLIERKDIDLIDIASPNDTHAEIAIAAARAGKMVMCEKPLARTAAEAEAMVAAVEKRRRAELGLVQLPPRPRRRAAQAVDRRRQARAHLPLPREVSAGLDDLADLPQGGEGLWRLDVAVAGSGVTGDLLAHCIDTAMWLNGPIDDVTAMTETFIKDAQAQPDRQGRTPSASTMPARSCRGSATDRSPRSSRPATRAGTRRSTRSRSTASMRRPRGTCTTCIAAVVRSSRRGPRRAVGAASTSPTATIPT